MFLTAILVAQLASGSPQAPAFVTVALVENLEPVTAKAMVIHEPGPSGRDLIILSINATADDLAAGMTTYRRIHRDLESRRVVIHAVKGKPRQTPEDRIDAERLFERLRRAPVRALEGVGSARAEQILVRNGMLRFSR